jgi:hypothetical protein
MAATPRFRTALRRIRDGLTGPAGGPEHAPWAVVRDYPVARPAPRRR